MVLLGYNLVDFNDGKGARECVYVSNPGKNRTHYNGWVPLENITPYFKTKSIYITSDYGLN